jgi:hypothetical protein
MMKSAVTCVIFALFVSSNSFAGKVTAKIDNLNSNQCPQVDLNQGPESPFNQIPIYDQSGVKICYAYSASELIDYYRLKNKDTNYDLTNPIYAAWATYFKEAKTDQQGLIDKDGNELEVIAALKKNGVCSNSDIEAKFDQLVKSFRMNDAQILTYVESMYSSRNNIIFPGAEFSPIQNFTTRVILTCSQKTELDTDFRRNGYLNVAPTAFLQELFRDCETHDLDLPGVYEKNWVAEQVLQQLTNSALAKELPVVLKMCANVLSNHSYRGQIAPRQLREDCGHHSILVSAQASINGQCNYLLRNSWGIWRDSEATACACITHDKKYKQICSRSEAETYVGCWYKQKDILPNTQSIIGFK